MSKRAPRGRVYLRDRGHDVKTLTDVSTGFTQIYRGSGPFGNNALRDAIRALSSMGVRVDFLTDAPPKEILLYPRH